MSERLDGHRTHRRWRCLLGTLVAWASLVTASHADTPAAATDRSARFVEALGRVQIALPDGEERALVAGGAVEGNPLLTVGQAERCLATLDEAEAWPQAWLIVQLDGLAYDLVLRVQQTAEGGFVPPHPAFTAPRQDWSVAALKRSVRDATGRKAKGRTWNLILQGFSKRIVDRYVYDTPATPPSRGLMALLPPGSLLREAGPVDLGDGQRRTLALVLQQAEFVPSRCEPGSLDPFGHADSGTVLAVLTGDKELVHTLDLTPWLAGRDGRPLLPRYACSGADRGKPATGPLGPRFADRLPVELLRLEDLDGDGRALEFSLPARWAVDARELTQIVVGVDPATVSLRVLADQPPARSD